MSITLPTERVQAKDYNPKLLVIIGLPKSGKTTWAASIDDNLILDTEDGTRGVDALSVQVRTYADFFDVAKQLKEYKDTNGKFRYRRVTIDNATKLEEITLPLAAAMYRATPQGANWEILKDGNNRPLKDSKGNPLYNQNADIRTLPNGAGYMWTRKALTKVINGFKDLCETLILICHVKDKQIQRNGMELSEVSINLAGKTGDIVCSDEDGVAYCYREDKNTYLSFQGGDNIIRGSRCAHLSNKLFTIITSDKDNKITCNWKEIILD